MGLPTITRSIGFRDDMVDSSLWTTSNPPSGTLTISSDGDIITAVATFTGGTLANDSCLFKRTGLSILSGTSVAFACRNKTDITTNLVLTIELYKSTVLQQAITLPVNTIYTYQTFSLTNNGTLDE